MQPPHPLSSPSPPTFNLSQHQGLFKWVSSSQQVATVLEFQLQHQSLQWYSGLISFRMDWMDLLAVQETLKSLLQHHTLKASIFQCSASIMVQLSHLYMTTGKTIGLTRWTVVGKVMSLLFNMLSRFVIAFLPRSKHLLISWLQSTICSDFWAQENKICHCFHCFSSIFHEVRGYTHWSSALCNQLHCEEIPHVQGQRRSPSKMVGGVKSHLESNPIPTRDTQRAQTNLVHTRTQRPHRDWDRTVSEHLLWRYGSAVDRCRGRGSGCSRPGHGISPLGGGHH